MNFIYIILFISAVIYSKVALFWLSLWQIKEYRLDRFWAEYGKAKRIVKFWLFSGGRKIHKPKFTFKAIVIYFSSLLTSLGCIYFLLKLYFWGYYFTIWPLIFGLAIIYLSLPLFVAFFILIANLFSSLAKQFIYQLAKTRLSSAKNLLIIGITGSYGKTSTKEFLAQILARKFKIKKTPENVNTEIGVAKYILQYIDPDDEIFITEMGAYKIGEIKRICDITKPKIGIITGINEQHLALFGSLKDIMKAKYELIESLPVDGLAVFNGENKHCQEMASRWHGRKIEYKAAKYEFLTNIRNLPSHYKQNLAGGVEIAKYLGMTEEEIQEAIKDIRLGERMMKVYQGKNETLIIEDVYSANPDGVLAALDYLARQPQKIKIAVMPCLIELGSSVEEIHRKIGKRISQVCSLAIITTSDCFDIIKQEAGDKAVLAVTPEKLIEVLEEKMDPDTAVLLEGRIAQEVVDFVK